MDDEGVEPEKNVRNLGVLILLHTRVFTFSVSPEATDIKNHLHFLRFLTYPSMLE